MLGGLPTDPPVEGAGRSGRRRQLAPSSSVSYISIQCCGPSLRRMAVMMRVGERRTEDGMMANPSGSGPSQERNFHVAPPSRGAGAEDSALLAVVLAAVRKMVRSLGPVDQVVGAGHDLLLAEQRQVVGAAPRSGRAGPAK